MNIGCRTRFPWAVRVGFAASWFTIFSFGDRQARVVANDSPTANGDLALLAREKGLFVSTDADRFACQAKPGAWIEVSFVLHESFPGRRVMSDIRTHLAGTGWKPLKEDWFNPGTSSLHRTGWSQFVDEAGGALRDYWMWKAAWQDAKGDVIQYSLVYSRPFRSKVGLGDVSINGNWMSAAQAQANRDSMSRARDNGAKSGPR